MERYTILYGTPDGVKCKTFNYPVNAALFKQEDIVKKEGYYFIACFKADHVDLGPPYTKQEKATHPEYNELTIF